MSKGGLPSRIALSKSFRVSSMGGNTFLATFLFGVMRAPPLPTMSPLASGLYREGGGDVGPSSGGGGGGGGGAAFGGDCFGDSCLKN